MLQSDNDVGRILGPGYRPESIRVLLLTLDEGPGDDFDRWVTTDVSALIEQLRTSLSQLAGEGREPRSMAVVVRSAPATSPWQEAAMEATWQAVRGVVHSLTREFGSRRVRLNAVRAPSHNQTELKETLAFLASDGGAFVAGSSVDLGLVR